MEKRDRNSQSYRGGRGGRGGRNRKTKNDRNTENKNEPEKTNDNQNKQVFTYVNDDSDSDGEQAIFFDAFDGPVANPFGNIKIEKREKKSEYLFDINPKVTSNSAYKPPNTTNINTNSRINDQTTNNLNNRFKYQPQNESKNNSDYNFSNQPTNKSTNNTNSNDNNRFTYTPSNNSAGNNNNTNKNDRFNYKPSNNSTNNNGSFNVNDRFNQQNSINSTNNNNYNRYQQPNSSNNNRNNFRNASNSYNSNNQYTSNNSSYHQQSYNSNSKQDIFKNRPIEKNKDVFFELKAKLNPKLFNVDKKIYNELDKFNKIINFIVDKLPKGQKINAFFLVCKVFTLNDLKNISDKNEKSSIFGIFFEGEKFKLESVFKDICINFLMGEQEFEVDDIISMLDFFKILIDVSLSNTEILQPLLNLFERSTLQYPHYKQYIDMVKSYAIEREENVQNSYESAVSPTAEDLFRSKKNLIDNHKNKVWENLYEYKKGMIELTKENFYTPFRNSMNDMREERLDARDLFLYKNVQIAFTANIQNYSAFRECNFFLTFQIKTPKNWKRELTTPDWKHTDQLGNRSLLILSMSPDLLKIDAVCRSCAVARSADQNESNISIQFLNKGILPVVLISGEIKQNKKYYMFEPTSCWPAVQPVLQRLLKMNEHSFPSTLINKVTKLDFTNNRMPEVILLKTDVLLLEKPSNPKEFVKLASEKWHFDSFSDEQKDTLLRVDHEQYNALRYALQNILTLVNGAPGTGKTHFAREYIRVMSNSKQKPIVVVTFTNHALDAILEGIIGFYNKEEILRWGGPMRSRNQDLIERKWKNYYLSRSIRFQKNEIVTLKQHLKNLYNIRQMAYMCIKEIQKDPRNIRVYQKIIEVLNNFFNASKRIADRYPLNFGPRDLNDYMRYLRIRNGRINYTSLPDANNALICWLNGEQFYEKRNATYHEILNYNRRIVDGETYYNQFNFLNQKDKDYEYDYDKSNDDDIDDDEEEEEEDNDDDDDDDEEVEQKKANPDDMNLNSPDDENSEKDPSTNNNNNNDNNAKTKEKEEEEEEEEEINDKKYNDADIIELTRVEYDGSRISGNLPSKYLTDFLIGKFDVLFEVKNPENTKTPDALMIEYLKAISDPLTQMIEKFESNLQSTEILVNENETKEAGKYLAKMKLIGMTSTVASIRKEALEVAGCEIMLVEEAGELTESMLSCILPKTLKRLILIGDYQQLRPKVEHEMTMEPFNYDISLFEKLVVSAKEQKANCLFTLSVQRRMHPQISALIRNAFYTSGEEKMTDAKSTGLLGIPYGIPYRVRFIMHKYEENKIASRSHVNKEEAKYCASLVPFFICRGYKPEDITIIALYKGQKFEIEREIESLYNKVQRKDSTRLYDPFGKIRNPKRIRVVVLDNFQGEENKVIIVSLTRSDKPGFVKNRNRALVTLSRAREMLVVLGNERIFGKLCKNNEEWKRISTVASKINPYVMSNPKQKGLAVNKCTIHSKKANHAPSFLETPEQVFNYRFSYCKEKCNFQLPCGHLCQLACHCHSNPPAPNEHDDYYCPFRCEKRCVNGHQCTGNCGNCTHSQRCPNCRVKIHHVFPKCKHEADIECYLVTSRRAVCHAECGKRLSRCGHPCKLQCGHSGPCECLYRLTKECEHCERTFEYICGNPNPKCNNICNHVLKCGHTCMSKCYECYERGFHDRQCRHDCDFIFPCGHKCSHKCSESFPNHQHYFCTQRMYVNHNFSGNHSFSLQMLISECSTQFKCNHQCQHSCSVCGKKCSHICSAKCTERCECRCPIKCNICGKRCRALTGEKCAIFCPHLPTFKNIEEPPEDVGLLYVFHDNHFLPLNEAKKRISDQYEAIMHGVGEKLVPIHRLTCPCDNCRLTEPCVMGSWLFDNYNKDIEKVIGNIRSKSERIIRGNNGNEKSFDKINWFICQKCGHLFPTKFNNSENIVVKCPKCGFQKDK